MARLYLARTYDTFQKIPQRIFNERELAQIIERSVADWQQLDAHGSKGPKGTRSIQVPEPVGPRAVRDALLANTELQVARFKFPYRPTSRYFWGDVPSLAIAQTLDRNGYFSHFTAMQFHSLTDQIPKTIYFNVEQKTSGGGGAESLSQEGIDRAFSMRCRVSKNKAILRDQDIYRLNGRYTGQLGVVTVESEIPRIVLRITSIERTLIDATVRPVYAGGIFEVARAFKEAAGRISVEKLAQMLEKLDFTYPYHQTIGFYMERAGNYRDIDIALLRRFGLDFNFYLDYGIRNREYNDKWRLFIPKRF